MNFHSKENKLLYRIPIYIFFQKLTKVLKYPKNIRTLLNKTKENLSKLFFHIQPPAYLTQSHMVRDFGI